MTALDWVLVAVVVISTLHGLRKGLLFTLAGIVGIIGGIIAASWYAPQLGAWMTRWVHPFWEAELFSFLLIVFAVMLIAHLLGRALRGGVRTIGLGFVDRLLGGVFGFARGCVLVVLLFLALSLFFPSSAWVRNSRIAPQSLAALRQFASAMPQPMAERVKSGAATLHRSTEGGR